MMPAMVTCSPCHGASAPLLVVDEGVGPAHQSTRPAIDRRSGLRWVVKRRSPAVIACGITVSPVRADELRILPQDAGHGPPVDGDPRAQAAPVADHRNQARSSSQPSPLATGPQPVKCQMQTVLSCGFAQEFSERSVSQSRAETPACGYRSLLNGKVETLIGQREVGNDGVGQGTGREGKIEKQ